MTWPPPLELQGHRGARGHAPENTLPGLSEALAIGVHTLEVDVGLSRDGVVMVHHDPGLNPDIARDGTGAWVVEATPLGELRADELARFDVGRLRPGSETAARFPHQRPVDGTRIPSLDTVCRWLGEQPGHARLNVEVKCAGRGAGGPDPEEMADRVLDRLHAHGLGHRAQVQSFDWRVPLAVRERDPDLAIAFLSAQNEHEDTLQAGRGQPSPFSAGITVEAGPGGAARAIAGAGGRTWGPDHRDLDAVTLAAAHAHGLRVVAWTVNTPADIEAMLDLGVDGIVSDYPDRVRTACTRRGIALPTPGAASRIPTDRGERS